MNSVACLRLHSSCVGEEQDRCPITACVASHAYCKLVPELMGILTSSNSVCLTTLSSSLEFLEGVTSVTGRGTPQVVCGLEAGPFLPSWNSSVHPHPLPQLRLEG